MPVTTRLPWLLMATFGFSLPLWAHHPRTDDRVSVHPAFGIAGEYGTWTVTYRVGHQAIEQGGGIRVQLPDTWHAGIRNSAKRLQSTNPRGDHYVSARASKPTVRLSTTVEGEPPEDDRLVKSSRVGLDGRQERYVFVVRVEVLKGRLEQGDHLSVIYGDPSAGSRGLQAAVITTSPEPILFAVDHSGEGSYRLHSDRPTLEAISGQASGLLVTGPSVLQVDQSFQLRLTAVDALANPARDFADEVRLTVLQGEIDGPQSARFHPGQAWLTIDFTPRSPGLIRIEARALESGLQSRSNPMKAYSDLPDRRVYWGDLHSHSKYSWDGVGEGNFEYARDIAGLDFYAMTDHTQIPGEGVTRGLHQHVWEEYIQRNEQHYEPGRFVTLHAYEASFGSPYGHHNVYFRGKPGLLLAPGEATLPQLWGALKAGEALTIPHHTGKFPQVEWQPHDPNFRRNFEIYSAHGLSEEYAPDHPLAFEQSLFTSPSLSRTDAQFAQDAWSQGLILSTVAASDDHRAQPGQPHWGLAAVVSTGLSREEIFDALYERRSYGTTGARILLEFSVNGEPMGREIETASSPEFRIEAHGTHTLERVELLRYRESEGRFRVIRSFEPVKLDFEWNGKDDEFEEDSIYYVRLIQAGWIRDRIAMAWSSPIWVRRREP